MAWSAKDGKIEKSEGFQGTCVFLYLFLSLFPDVGLNHPNFSEDPQKSRGPWEARHICA